MYPKEREKKEKEKPVVILRSPRLRTSLYQM
jgi:hypothetical protein